MMMAAAVVVVVVARQPEVATCLSISRPWKFPSWPEDPPAPARLLGVIDLSTMEVYLPAAVVCGCISLDPLWIQKIIQGGILAQFHSFVEAARGLWSLTDKPRIHKRDYAQTHLAWPVARHARSGCLPAATMPGGGGVR